MKTKILYAEDIRNNLYSSLISRDVKIDYREIFLAMDRAINFFAKNSFLENWKSGIGKIDDLWQVDFSPISVTDIPNQNSFFNLPTSNYVNLPSGQGIQDVYFMNNNGLKKRYFKPIIIKNFKDVSGYRSSIAQNNAGRISCYVKNRIIYFDRGKIDAVYGQIGIRLVLRDASLLQDADVYPVPADIEEQFINKSIDFFIARRIKEPDLIKDMNDKQPGK